ncbi:hypothetical protein [uncultured Chryseobacterium sp.]|uniref:hypothetical protein n=1 Tax=uncultured Chryseobacterium sp. TaxID=259322 RepID=UPI0025DE8F75|nr:hypothetical protein [uncultured Chryseobacterium sp.]
MGIYNRNFGKQDQEVLKTMKYLKNYKLENDDFYSGNMVFHEEIEEFLGELYHCNNFRHNEKGLYNFNLFYSI